MTRADRRETEREQISFLNVGAFLVGVALGSFAYRAVLELLLELDVVVEQPAFDDAGVRDAILQVGPWGVLLAGAVALVGAVRWAHERAPRRVILGAALLGAGLAASVWGAVDMHSLGLYEWEPGSPAGLLDLVYHGTGVLVAIAGYALVAAPARSQRAP